MGLSAAVRNALLDHLTKKAAYTAPDNLFVALSTADPGADGSTIAEPVGNAYARKSTAAADWNAASAGAVTNANAVTFAAANGGAWGTITHIALFSALTAGTFLGRGALTASKEIADGDTANFATATLSISMTDP